jgi:hypothetical protein
LHQKRRMVAAGDCQGPCRIDRNRQSLENKNTSTSWVSQGDCRAREGASRSRLFAGDQARQRFAAGVCGSARISVATRAPLGRGDRSRLSIDLDDASKLLYGLVRTQVDDPPLVWSAELVAAAQDWAPRLIFAGAFIPPLATQRARTFAPSARAPRRRAPGTDLGCASAIPRYSQRHPRRRLRPLHADHVANDTLRRRRCRQRVGAKGLDLPVPPARQHRRLSSVLDQRAYGVTWPINFSGGRVPHCERNPSSAETRLPPLCTFNRSVSAQCSCTRPHGSAQ